MKRSLIYLVVRWTMYLLVIMQVGFWYKQNWQVVQGFYVLFTVVPALLVEYCVRKGNADVRRHEAWVQDQMMMNGMQDIRTDEAQRKTEVFKDKTCDPQG